MDMWDPYIAATQAYVPGADDKIVFDKFHVLRTVNEAVDKVRRQEHKTLKATGDERLKGTKHLWLANEENVPEWRRAEFEAVKGENLKTGRAWAIKESLRQFGPITIPSGRRTTFDVGTFGRLTPAWVRWSVRPRPCRLTCPTS